MTRNLPHHPGPTGRVLKLYRTRILVALAVVSLGASACSDDSTAKSSGQVPDGGHIDAGGDAEPPGADTSDADLSDAGDATSPDVPSPDADPPPRATRAQSLCATAGVARGAGLVLYQCTGPIAPSGTIATGTGFTLQAGVTRLVTP